MNKPIHIFKPGKHVAMSGQAFSFTESDIAATVAAYDPAKHEAPLVVGHPQHDNPAYGWVQSLAFTDGIEASPHQVDPAFAEMVDRGAFKKISASFYAPDAPSNPVPGVYYLRHVGFLGAQPPAVKGLRAPEFAEVLGFTDGEEGVIEFSELGDVDNANILRNLREWIIGKFGRYEADKAIPDHLVQPVKDTASSDDANATHHTPELVESQPEGDPMSDEDKARMTALKKENDDLKKSQANFSEAKQQHQRDVLHASHLSFAEDLIAEGKLLPANMDLTVAILDFMAAQNEPIEFGEGEARQPLIAAHKAFLSAQPKQVDFSEIAGVHAEGANAVNFSAPAGFTIDAGRLALHQQALSYQATHKTTYDVALSAVSA